MENLNAEQVKKALGSCYPIGATRCKECPYSKNGSVNILFTETRTCYDQMAIDALALINSQEQRIKELTEDKEKLGYLIDELVKEKRELWEENKKLTEENERLTRLANLRQRDLDNANDLLFKVEDEVERLKAPKYYIHSDDRIEMIPTVESVRADTVRKMQERLKADAVTIQDHTGKLGVVVGVGNIDDVAREMLEGENEN